MEKLVITSIFHEQSEWFGPKCLAAAKKLVAGLEIKEML